MIAIYSQGCPRSVMVNAMDSGFVVRESSNSRGAIKFTFG